MSTNLEHYFFIKEFCFLFYMVPNFGNLKVFPRPKADKISCSGLHSGGGGGG